MKKLVVALSVVLFACCGKSQAQVCAGQSFPPNQNLGSIQIKWSAGSAQPPSSTALSDAAHIWNQCASNGGIPGFRLTSGGDAVFPLTYLANTQNSIASCGHYDSGTKTATLYHWSTRSDGTRQDCTTTAAGIAQNIAHEIGHRLGLSDEGSECSTHIMAGYNAAVNRTLHDDECEEADDLNETPEERADDCDPPLECQCDQDDLACLGTPIVINFSIGTYQLCGPEEHVIFDLNADGRFEATTWTSAGANEAFLWLDRDGNGFVTDGRELFGNHTPLSNGEVAANGFEALRQYDTNADGKIDASDDIWTQLRVWTDLNHNAFSEPSEIQTLSQAGVVSISLNYHSSRRRDQFGNEFNFESTVGIAYGNHIFFRPVYDITFVKVSR